MQNDAKFINDVVDKQQFRQENQLQQLQEENCNVVYQNIKNVSEEALICLFAIIKGQKTQKSQGVTKTAISRIIENISIGTEDYKKLCQGSLVELINYGVVQVKGKKIETQWDLKSVLQERKDLSTSVENLFNGSL